jgi:signal transduction histidine kinase
MSTLTGWVDGGDDTAGRRVVRASLLLWPVLLTWILVISLSPARDVVTRQHLAELARNLASGLFLVAGVLALALWRLSAAPMSARHAVAWFVLGASLPGSAAIGPLLHEPAAFAHGAPSTRALFLIPVLALLLPGAHWSRQSFAQPIPLRYLMMLGWAVGCAVGVLLFARHSLQADSLAASWRLICCASVLAWLLLAYRAGAARSSVRRAEVPLVLVFLLLALAELFRLFAVAGVGAVLGTAPGIQLAAAGVLVAAAARDLRAAHQDEEQCAVDLSRTVDELQRQLTEVEQAQRERLHDARSAVSGVIGASTLLTTAGPVRAIDRDRLHRMIGTELHRLQALLETRWVEPVAEFDLADALEPVVLSHQLDRDGLAPLCVDLSAPPVIGRPQETARVVDNLLRNARVHAPGAHVSISVRL